MKKVCALLLSLLLLLSLFSCGTPAAPEITDADWQLASVTKDTPDHSGLLYVSDAYVAFFQEGADLPRLEGVLTAKRGTLTFNDLTNGKTYTGTYDGEDEFSPDATAYKITIEGKRGHGLALRSIHNEENDFYTFSLTVGDYTLLFMQ